MKLLLENWREYLTEDKRTISFDEVIELLRNDPDQERSLDFRAGEGHKSWGGVFDPQILVPFDYGEFPELINVADNMGWDFIVARDSNVEDKNLQPVGHISYYEDKELWDSHGIDDMPENVGGNSKIVLANDGDISAGDKAHLTEYFGPMWQFKEPEWY